VPPGGAVAVVVGGGDGAAAVVDVAPAVVDVAPDVGAGGTGVDVVHAIDRSTTDNVAAGRRHLPLIT
jgi:hypothetical protein